MNAIKPQPKRAKKHANGKSADDRACAAGVKSPGVLQRAFGAAATAVSHAAGRPSVFALAVGCVLVWAVTGPLFGYSETWQLVINTGTTIVTFLMVFLIQNSQNRDGAAIQVKLDELIRASTAKNRFVGIERLTEDEIEELRLLCETQAKSMTSRRTAAPAKAQAKARLP